MRKRKDQRRSRLTPDTSHRDTKQRPDGEELTIGTDETTAQLEDADQTQVGHECPFTPKPIGEKAKDESAERSEQQGEGDGRSDMRGVDLELRG